MLTRRNPTSLIQTTYRSTRQTSALKPQGSARHFSGRGTGHLAPEQVSFFKEKGYLVLEGFKNRAELNAIKRAAERILDKFNPKEDGASIFRTNEQTRTADDYFLTSGDKIRCFFEEDAFDTHGELKQDKQLSINKIGHAMHEFDPVFRAFSDCPEYSRVIYSLGFRQPRVIQSMYIFKQPWIGGEVNPHQDNCFLYTKPTSCVGLWIGVEDSTLDNGCLWAVPGSHRLGTRNRFIRNPEAPQGGTVFVDTQGAVVAQPETLSTEGAIPLEVPAGTLVVIHGDLVHFSHKNQSAQSRHAYTLHVLEAQSTEYDASNWLLRAPYVSTQLTSFPTFSSH
eukprot:gb/GEZN01008321.1/.p1 GENE.gb/GEZN01008321.1/~~gb/GEZN01008321.1/.p1  ORF type:complete len:337 (+),score=44.18 gb/GEZN01008321.1/:236-1246(+)